MSAGAFSDPAVLEASKRIVCVFVDCDWGKKNKDLSARYSVKGYPTIIFCEPDGKPMGALGHYDPEGVARVMNDAADRVAGKPKLTGKSLAEAQKGKMPVAIFFRDGSPASQSVEVALADELLKATLSRFTLVLSEYEKGSAACVKYDVDRAPTIVVIDPAIEKPETRPLARIAGSRSARELQRDLEDVLSARTPPASGAAGGTPAPKVPEEKLSDDQIERLYIQARVSVAQDLIKRGKKEKAIEIYEDLIKSYPKHVDTAAVKKLLEEARK